MKLYRETYLFYYYRQTNSFLKMFYSSVERDTIAMLALSVPLLL